MLQLGATGIEEEEEEEVKLFMCLIKHNCSLTYWGADVHLHSSELRRDIEVGDKLHVSVVLPCGKNPIG
jgi:hypothetical protein